jgi:hypothetical protein
LGKPQELFFGDPKLKNYSQEKQYISGTVLWQELNIRNCSLARAEHQEMFLGKSRTSGTVPWQELNIRNCSLARAEYQELFLGKSFTEIYVQ